MILTYNKYNIDYIKVTCNTDDGVEFGSLTLIPNFVFVHKLPNMLDYYKIEEVFIYEYYRGQNYIQEIITQILLDLSKSPMLGLISCVSYQSIAMNKSISKMKNYGIYTDINNKNVYVFSK